MDMEKAMGLIEQALEDTLGRKVDIDAEMDLLDEGVLDSLDGVKFVFQLEELARIRFPTEDLAEKGYFKVPQLIEFLTRES